MSHGSRSSEPAAICPPVQEKHACCPHSCARGSVPAARGAGCWARGPHAQGRAVPCLQQAPCLACAQPGTGVVYRCFWGPRTPNALHPRETPAPSSWVAPSWSAGNRHEKPLSAHRVVNPVCSKEKINAAVQHGQGHQADVQRGGEAVCCLSLLGEGLSGEPDAWPGSAGAGDTIKRFC